jgi:hypothetical protein
MKVQSKRIKRSSNQRVRALENVTITLIGELRTALYQIKQGMEELEVAQGILALSALGRTLSEDDLEVLEELADKATDKPAQATETAPKTE